MAVPRGDNEENRFLRKVDYTCYDVRKDRVLLNSHQWCTKKLHSSY